VHKRGWLAVPLAVSMFGSLIAFAQSAKPAAPEKESTARHQGEKADKKPEPAPENVKTVEQQFKNIKSLTGAPADQLVPAMQ
jgi:hypothetical protein